MTVIIRASQPNDRTHSDLFRIPVILQANSVVMERIKKRELMNAPNVLSAYRILAAPVLLLLAWREEREWFNWLLLLSFCTDMADGYLARRFNQSTKLGAQLDSVGDAATFLAAVAGVFIFERDFVDDHIFIVAVAFVPYILQILLAISIYGRPSSFHTYLAKTAALLQGIFLLALFFFHPVKWLFYLAVIITILEIVEEIVLLFLLPKWKMDVKGVYWVLKQRRLAKKRKRLDISS